MCVDLFEKCVSRVEQVVRVECFFGMKADFVIDYSAVAHESNLCVCVCVCV